MRAIREPSLAAPVSLAALALFFGGGPGDGSVPWLGTGALVALLVLLGLRGVPGGWPAAVTLGLLAVWCAVSIWWSWLPDRSWDYANRTALYALAAGLGLFAAARTRELANGLAIALGAVIGWSLLGKVLPPVYDYGGIFQVARLQGPIGLWNQLALATDYALVLALAIRGRRGRLLAYLALIALALTYSRGGLVTAAVVVAVWFVFADDRDESAATMVVAAIPAAVVVAIAFVLPGVTSDHQSTGTRWRDGLVFGVLLIAGAAVVWLVERRLTRVQQRAALGVAVAGALAALAVIVVHGIGSGAVGNGGQHVLSTSSNFRFTWWRQAWDGFTHHVLAGTGAGSFHVVNLLYRRNYLDYTIEPHNLPLQVLAELGVVGLALLAVACVLLIRPSLRRGGRELALALFLPAFLVHSLVDVDWDFAAVAVPAFVAAGALAGRAPRRVSTFALLPAAGVALVLAGAFFSPWLAGRYASDAVTASPARAYTLADRAHSLDPLLVEPFWAKALAAETQGKLRKAFTYYVEAVRRQPMNAQTWRAAGQFAWDIGCPFQAWKYLERYTELDQKARQSAGGATYQRARALVNARKYSC